MSRNRFMLVWGVLSTALLLAGCGGGGGTGGGVQTGSRGAVVTGRAVDSQGRPVKGATVTLTQPGRATRQFIPSTTTDVDGRFTFTDVPAGTFTVDVRAVGANGLMADVQVAVTVPAGGSVDVEVHIHTETAFNNTGVTATSGAVAGFVTDAQTGAPVAGAEVLLRELSNGDTLHAVTDRNGFFEFTDLPPGAFELEAAQGSFASQQIPVQVQAGIETQADITLFPPSSNGGNGGGHHGHGDDNGGED